MKRITLFTILVLLFCSFSFAQVFADFEKDDGGFAKVYGSSTISIGKVADPSGKSTGVLGCQMDLTTGDKQMAIAKSKVDASKTRVITYWLYLPKDTPDSLYLKIFAQAPVSWGWNSFDYWAKDIPKEVWFPVTFDCDGKVGLDKTKGAMERIGLEFNGTMMKKNGTTWKGTIYVDNVSHVGVEPVKISDFEKDAGGFAIPYGTSMVTLNQVVDPTTKSSGVLEANIDFSQGDGKAALSKSKVDASKSQILSYWLYLPKDTPDSLAIKVFAQGPVNWDWQDFVYIAKNIPKETWFPVNFDLDNKGAKTSNFDKTKGALERAGIEFGTYYLKGTDKTWKGKILVDNATLLGIETGKKWVLNTFESVAGGTQGWKITSWAKGLTTLNQASVSGQGVLKASVDLSKDAKAVMDQSFGTLFYQADTKTFATYLSVDVFLPTGTPLETQVSLAIAGDAALKGWHEQAVYLKEKPEPGQIATNQWYTLTMDLSKGVADGALDLAKNATVLIQMYNATDKTWKADVLFDNVTIGGLEAPADVPVSPKTQAKTVTYTFVNGTTYDYVRFDWVDNKAGTEKYNIYQSESPITDITAKGVRQIVAGIPHGMQKYAVRPWSADGSKKTYYYAVTCFTGTEETPVTADSKVGPIEVKTSKAYTLQYDKDFNKTFVLDGQDAEFTNYKKYEIKPEIGNYVDETLKWDDKNTDLNFKTTMVIDDKYLYISADVTDDDLRKDAAQQAWEGDALEFFMGLYDTRFLTSLHSHGFKETNGDWRIGFTGLGKTTLGGTNPVTINGVEATVFEKFTGDGYIIEARLALDSLAQNKKFQIADGMLMPFRIDANDWDPSKGDTKRSLTSHVGGLPVVVNEENKNLTHESWLRPDAWGYLCVVGAPVANEIVSDLPAEFKLYNNYPNPFNPATKIKYDLPSESKVSLKVYDILGREVATLFEGSQPAGYHEIVFDASRYASGVYIYRLIANNFVQTKKMMLIK